MKQPEATFKIRHLKMGISLASALLSCDPSITLMLVVSPRNLSCLVILMLVPCSHLLMLVISGKLQNFVLVSGKLQNSVLVISGKL